MCFACKKERSGGRVNQGGFFVCEPCRDLITVNKYFICPSCAKRNIWGILDKSCVEKICLKRFFGSPLPCKDKLVKDAIHSFKYEQAKEMAFPLANILINFLDKNNFRSIINKDMLLAPIPLYNFKERERGFNQSAEIAILIAKYYNIEFANHLLIKTKNTRNQADIESREDRAENIKNAFACQKDTSQIRGKTVILVDDVYTTGSTMRECAKTLKKYGAKQIWGMTLAK
jgi:competence protein ComFC